MDDHSTRLFSVRRRHARVTEARPLSVDALDDVLQGLRMTGTFYCTAAYSSPWALALPSTGGEARLHVITTGSAFLRVAGLEPLALEQGDLVLLPHGAGHELACQRETPLLPQDAIRAEYFGDHYAHFTCGRGDETRLVCIRAAFDDPVSRRLIAWLPKIIHVPAAATHTLLTMDHVVRLIAQEARELRPGGRTIIQRLTDVLLIQALRWWLENEPATQYEWLRALHDKQISRVIRLIHRDPARAWTMNRLAAEAGMSRSLLALRFKELVGVSVMRYLVGWRMQLALSCLRREDIDIAQLAERVGYQSQSAFIRAFKRYIGAAPGAARATHISSLGQRAMPMQTTVPGSRATIDSSR
jgi:AraC-like DNA-binding protein